MRAVRNAPLDPEWVNGTLGRLETLIREGDEADLAERTVALVADRRATELPVDELST